MASYRSQVQQSLHYFARPHQEIRRTPIGGRAAWRGDDLSEDQWLETLETAAIDELCAALEHAGNCGRPTGELTRDDFPLPTLGARFEGWRDELARGRGFLVLRGIPVERFSEAEAERFFWCFGLHMGIPGAQNPQGDLVGHVRDTGAPMDGSVRQYRTREAIDYHCDLADVVGLLCLHTAAKGGTSCIASSVHAYDEILRRRPDLVDQLYRPMKVDTKGEGGIPFIPVEPCRYAEGQLRTFWHSSYFRSLERYDWAEPLSDSERQVLELHSEIMAEPGTALQMELQRGDIQMVNNHTIVHGRGAFEDGEQPRHLLRLWLSLPHPQGLASRLRAERSRLQVLGRLVGMRLKARFTSQWK